MIGASLGLAFALLLAHSAPVFAQVYHCRGYPQADVVAQIKSQTEALRRLEREADDRIRGLDTRPYDWLLEQARASEQAIAVPALLAAEDALLQTCRNAIRPVRRGCAAGAAALVEVIGELAAGDAKKDSKQVYLQTMPLCERWLSLTPLQTALRSID
jgi:hypothetical protein